MSTTVRVSDEAHRLIGELAEEFGQTQGQIIEEAVEELRRKRYAERFQQSYAELQDDDEAWEEFQQDKALWETTTGDGLE